jgi:hypothetical protein
VDSHRLCCCHQILWTFSIYLEAVAILPQLVLLQRTQNIDNLTGNYVFLLGCAGPPSLFSSHCSLFSSKCTPLFTSTEHRPQQDTPSQPHCSPIV